MKTQTIIIYSVLGSAVVLGAYLGIKKYQSANKVDATIENAPDAIVPPLEQWHTDPIPENTGTMELGIPQKTASEIWYENNKVSRETTYNNAKVVLSLSVSTPSQKATASSQIAEMNNEAIANGYNYVLGGSKWVLVKKMNFNCL